MANDYLQEILSGQSQRKVTGQGALTPRQVEAAFKGELSARYEAEARNRSLALQQRSIENQESQYASTLELQKDQLSAQKQGEMVSAGITGLGVTAYAAPKLMAAFGGGAAGAGAAGAATSTLTGAGLDAALTAGTAAFGTAASSGLAGAGAGGAATMLGTEAATIAATETASAAGGLAAGTATGAEAGSTIGPWGAVIGAAVGAAVALVASDTWLCTQINSRFGIDKEDWAALSKLRRYSLKNHREDTRAYLIKGYMLTDVIREDSVYESLKSKLVEKCCELVRQGDLEGAYQHYRAVTLRLCSEFEVDLTRPVSAEYSQPCHRETGELTRSLPPSV